jgi:hypothetical protein
MLKKLSLVAVLAGIAFVVPVAAQQAPVAPAPVQRTPIGKTEVPGSNYEVITAIVTIQPASRPAVTTIRASCRPRCWKANS